MAIYTLDFVEYFKLTSNGTQFSLSGCNTIGLPDFFEKEYILYRSIYSIFMHACGTLITKYYILCAGIGSSEW